MHAVNATESTTYKLRAQPFELKPTSVLREAHAALRELDRQAFGELVDGRLRDAVDSAVAGRVRDAQHT